MKIVRETSEISFTVRYWTRKLKEAFGAKRNLVIKQFERSLEVYFYSTRIALIDLDTDTIRLANGGWETKTTKNHLNQVLRVMNVQQAVFQKKFQWFLGEKEFNTQIEIKAKLN
ncbi:hypothetical protein [Hymenobacter sublimis]|uniref:Uncharacterized protein n=1 Tax=Hymenobacter sublimis TaxID=2933777 RepID=A0ABY4JD64_9BACT|nr:hypothetical protein [Hymenobacter sublimis]UPL50520.1 hypothetical protein MWH26_06335 [Hymenobacter sublimis]